MTGFFEFDDFSACLNTVFEVASGTFGTVEMVLVEAQELETRYSKGFSLIFKGPEDKPMVQKIRQVSHPSLGRLDLFLVPVGQQQEIIYQVVVNRLVN